MSDETTREAPLREEAHPKARALLTDAFFWDANDPCGPFGNDTALEVYEALRDLRDEDSDASAIELLDDLLARWEVANEGWDAVDPDQVQAIGADDELGLLVRDEAILALAFGDLVLTGRVDAEPPRRAMLALARQALPPLLHGFGERMKAREERVARMRAILGQLVN
jgi:uncharacterized protein YfeS